MQLIMSPACHFTCKNDSFVMSQAGEYTFLKKMGGDETQTEGSALIS